MATIQEIRAIVDLINSDEKLRTEMNEILNPKRKLKQYIAKEYRKKINALWRGAHAGYKSATVTLGKEDIWGLIIHLADATLFNYSYEKRSRGDIWPKGTHEILCDPTKYADMVAELSEVVIKYYDPGQLPEHVKLLYSPTEADREKAYYRQIGMDFEEFNN